MPDIVGLCSDCKKDVHDPNTTRTSKAVKCDLCSNWYHTKCQNVEDKIYNAVNSVQGKMSPYQEETCCGESSSTTDVSLSLFNGQNRLLVAYLKADKRMP